MSGQRLYETWGERVEQWLLWALPPWFWRLHGRMWRACLKFRCATTAHDWVCYDEYKRATAEAFKQVRATDWALHHWALSDFDSAIRALVRPCRCFAHHLILCSRCHSTEWVEFHGKGSGRLVTNSVPV